MQESVDLFSDACDDFGFTTSKEKTEVILTNLHSMLCAQNQPSHLRASVSLW